MTSVVRRFAVTSRHVVTPGEVRAAAIVIDGERIESVIPCEDLPSDVTVEDFDSLVISPGIVDSHVHINEPGRTDWEGFETATRAAAAGGVTTLVDMPLNSTPVTTTVEALEAKWQAATGKCLVDVGFYGGLIPGNRDYLEPLIDAGVCGIKTFLCDSGLADFPATREEELRDALPILKRRQTPLLVHAELVDDDLPAIDVTSYRDWARMRPSRFESRAIDLLRRLCGEYQAPMHVVHLATGAEAIAFADMRRAGLPMTIETCSHYLHFAEEELLHADPRFKCAPPIRRRNDRDQLWMGLASGAISTIGSDHSPCPPAMKRLADNDWRSAWGGISSLQLTSPIVWRGARSRSLPYSRLAEWLSSNPARLVGMDHRKGRIAGGYDADLCIWDPDDEWTVAGADLHHRHKLTAYEGERLLGRVKRTYLRGQAVFDEGKLVEGPIGELLRRGG